MTDFAARLAALGTDIDAAFTALEERVVALESSQAAPEPEPVPEPTPTPEPTPVPEPEKDPEPVPTASVVWGMSSPKEEWDTRLGEVQSSGKKLAGRRLFVSGFSAVSTYLDIAKAEAAAGRQSVLSLSTDTDAEWQKFANGTYDAGIAELIQKTKNAGIADKVYWVVKHEPFGDGTASTYAAMQKHLAPIFKNAGIRFGPIVNGYGFSNKSQAMSDAEYAAWIPDDLLPLCYFVGADIYQGGTFDAPGEMAGPRVKNFSAWADRHNVKRLLIGEFNGMDATAIKSATDAIKADPRYIFAAVFNSSRNNRVGVDWVLSGDRLKAFQAVL